MFARVEHRWGAVPRWWVSALLTSLAFGQPVPLRTSVIPHTGSAAAPPWYEPGNISWALWITAAAAAIAACWAAALRRQVNAKTRALQLSFETQIRAREFDTARNEVLEHIARHAPLQENMSRLAVAIEGQINNCCCAIVMPPDGKSFLNGKAVPMLIAPGLPSELHPEVLLPLAELFNSGGSGDDEAQVNEQTLMTTLLGILWASGLAFCSGRMAIAFSGNGEAAGVVMLFLKSTSEEVEPVDDSTMQSASRLVALAADHSRMHDRLFHEARHDSLTGLPNRVVAEDRLEQAVARAERSQEQFAILCVDLDGFKAINDQLGHDAGDEILRAVSTRLRSQLRHSDTLARMGGDEFLVLLERCSTPSAARAVAESLIAALEAPFAVNSKQLRVSSSIGVGIFPAAGRNAAQLRRNADLAMYRAKSLGGSQVSVWSGELALSAAAARG